MPEIPSISVEFVRPGPSHNQLLSPLTQYLALCGDFPAANLSVPYEHSYFMRRLRHLEAVSGLSEGEQQTRRGVLDELGQRMAQLLDQIPGLAAGLANARRSQGPLTHVHLIMSAAELALLPFELCTVPPNCGGGGKNLLLLQNEVPLCMTRAVREVSRDHVRWPDVPKILFVASLPDSADSLVRSHLQALLASVRPLVDPKKEAKEGLRKAVEDYVTILPNATIYKVQEACRRTAYTHIHVLAHGAVDMNSEARSIGLAMPGKLGGTDVVTGARFATALKTTSRLDTSEATSLPSVVTLATCYSAKMADVVYSGASFAHAVHQAGVPFVVASQFPLSFEGSVHMADVLYRKLLLGEDPRAAIHTVRRKLYALKAADTHDWASLVVYAALPPDIDQQLDKTRYELARRRIDMALYRIDMIIEGKAPDKIKHGDIREKLEQVKKLAKRLPGHGAYATEVKGLKGAIYKRIAETHFRCIPRQRIDKAPDQMQKDKEPRPECYQALIESQKYYWQAVRDNFHMSKEEQQIKVSRHWALVQYLCLGAVLGGKLRPEHWYAAKASADFDAKFPDPQSQIEAHSSLAELYLLLLAYAAEEGPRSGWKLLPPKTKPAAIKQQAAKHVRAIVELASDEGASFIAYATRRQLRRYVDWWGKPEFVKLLPEKDKAGRKDWSDPKDENAPVAVAQHLLGLLPDDDEA